MKRQMQILRADDLYKTNYFAHLNAIEVEHIYTRILENKSLIVSYREDGNEKFQAILDMDCKDAVHIREVDGNFVKTIGMLEIFATACAKIAKKSFLSFCTEKDGVEWIGERMGFSRTNEGDFIKRINI